MNSEVNIDQELDAWIKKSMGQAVEKLTKKGFVDGVVVEAKPAWVLPMQILIGKIRGQGNRGESYWFICGDLPTDIIDASVASSPREAARHFSLKWQVDAEREQKEGDERIHRAEALYGLVEESRLWLSES